MDGGMIFHFRKIVIDCSAEWRVAEKFPAIYQGISVEK